LKEINGVEIEFFEGNAYVRLNQYEKLLDELKELKSKQSSYETEKQEGV